MKNKKLRGGSLLALGTLLLLTGLSFGLLSPKQPGNTEREDPRTGDKVTVIALYPSVGTIKDLMTLRQNKLIDVPNLAVVGVYHEKEKTDYGESKAFVASVV
jgi:hypothetical protein